MLKKLTVYEVAEAYGKPGETVSRTIEKYLACNHCVNCGCVLKEMHE